MMASGMCNVGESSTGGMVKSGSAGRGGELVVRGRVGRAWWKRMVSFGAMMVMVRSSILTLKCSRNSRALYALSV